MVVGMVEEMEERMVEELVEKWVVMVVKGAGQGGRHGSGGLLPFACWKKKERKMKEREEERGGVYIRGK